MLRKTVDDYLTFDNSGQIVKNSKHIQKSSLNYNIRDTMNDNNITTLNNEHHEVFLIYCQCYNMLINYFNTGDDKDVFNARCDVLEKIMSYLQRECSVNKYSSIYINK